MKFVREPLHETDEIKYTLTVSLSELIRASLDGHDRYLIQYFGREGGSIEEKLMGLQVIARRIEEIERVKEELLENNAKEA